MSPTIYLTLWEVIGIISGVFFFMMFLVALASYLHQIYTNDIQFNALDESENGLDTDGNIVQHKSIFVYYCDKMFDKINAIKVYLVSKTTASSTTNKSKKKEKKKKKHKTKVKIPLAEVQNVVSSDEETGPSNYNHTSKNPSKTQNLYAGSTSTSRLTDYTLSDSANDIEAQSPSSFNSNTSSSSTSSSSMHGNNSSIDLNMDSSINISTQAMDQSTSSFSGRAARKHPT